MDKNQKAVESAPQRAAGWVREKIDDVQVFYRDTRLELQRVTWPTRKQVRATTIVVITTVFFFGAFFFLSDQLVSKVVNGIFGYISK